MRVWAGLLTTFKQEFVDPGKNIVSLETIDPTSVATNTVFADVPLPDSVLAIFDDASSALVSLEWLEGSYNGATPGTYTLFANVTLTPGITNTLSIQASIDVTVDIQENSLFFVRASSQLVEFGTTADIQFTNTNTFSIAFDFKIPANPAANHVVLGNLNPSGVGRGYEVQIQTTGIVFIELRNTSSTNRIQLGTVADYADNAWHRCLITKPATAANLDIRIDGTLDVTVINNNLSATIASTDPFTIGGRSTPSSYLDGYLDNIAIWNTDEEANQASIFAAHDYRDLTSEPIHYWRFDGASLLDVGTSANKLNGTAVNSPTFSTDVPVNQGSESFMYRIQDGVKANKSEEAGYFVWGANVIEDGGTYYYIGNKWDDVDGFNGWVHYNRIYIGTSANKLGPFTLATEISSLRSQAWAADVVTNPNIIKVGATYYLFYVGSNYSTVSYPVINSEARANQQIGVATASSPAGPWTPYASNPILSPRPGEWDQTIVNNPTVFVDTNGLYRMVYKSDYFGDLGNLRLGMVTSNDLLAWSGQGAEPNFAFEVEAEDPTVWQEAGKWWGIAKAMDSSVVPVGNGILFISDDGITWRLALGEHAYSLGIDWTDATSETFSKIERPFVLVEAGDATALFTAVLTTGNTSFNIGRDLTALP